MKIGIYALRFNNTDKVYIGQSTNIAKRFNEHLRELSAGTHKQKLQNAYDEYGAPTLDILIEVDNVAELDTLEAEAIEIFNSVDNGFNTLHKPGAPNVVGYNSVLAKYSKEEYIEACRLLASTDMLVKDIADALDMSEPVVYGIASCKSHTWLATEVPEWYTVVIEKSRTGRYLKRKKDDIQTLLAPDGNTYIVNGTYADFAREHNIDRNGISRVLSGTRKSYKGWKLYTQPTQEDLW